MNFRENEGIFGKPSELSRFKYSFSTYDEAEKKSRYLFILYAITLICSNIAKDILQS